MGETLKQIHESADRVTGGSFEAQPTETGISPSSLPYRDALIKEGMIASNVPVAPVQTAASLAAQYVGPKAAAAMGAGPRVQQAAGLVGGLAAGSASNLLTKIGKSIPEAEELVGGAESYVYHATDKSRLASIVKNGLRPGTWYARTPQEALRSGVGSKSGNVDDLVVLAVPKNNVVPVSAPTGDIGESGIASGKFVRSGIGNRAVQVKNSGLK